MAKVGGSAGARGGFYLGGTIRMEGGRELDRMLRDLDRKTQRKTLSTALRAGAKVILAEAKSRAPVHTGLLKRKLAVRVARKRKGESLAFKLRTGEGDYGGSSFYGTLIETGYLKAPVMRLPNGRFVALPRKMMANRKRKKHTDATRAEAIAKGYTPVPPNPFMANAFKAKVTEAVDAVRRQLIDGIMQAAQSK